MLSTNNFTEKRVMQYRKISYAVIFSLLCFLGYRYYNKTVIKHAILKIEKQEATINELSIIWQSLSRDIENLCLPGLYSKKFFKKDMIVYPITENLKTSESSLGIKTSYLEAKQKPEKWGLSLWKTLFDKIKYFENVQLAVVKGRLSDAFIVDLKLDALARNHKDEFLSLQIKFSITLENFGDTSKVKISEWKNKKIDMQSRRHLLFKDITEQTLKTPHLVDLANGSKRESLFVSYLKKLQKSKNVKLPTMGKPSMGVVDIDGDSWDDLYIFPSVGKNIFLKNNRGVFEEYPLHGLDIDDTSSVIFADFDNDGDQDVFVGKLRKKGAYFLNKKGVYVESNSNLNCPLPFFITSFSVVDYNNDGLLDIYISTYASQGVLDKSLDKYFSREEIEKYRYMMKHNGTFFRHNYNISQNVLLKNQGNGKFSKVEKSPISVNKATYQSTWTDFNHDGKQDVYIANDFSHDHLFLNTGSGNFQDVSSMLGGVVSFSMGASFGDYNNNGLFDIYVTNMYSKAGVRIIKELTPVVGMENFYLEAASGNYLFSNTGTKLQLFTGLGALWSWGSQFIDLDNDGYLDIYAPCGQYTAPKIFDTSKDT